MSSEAWSLGDFGPSRSRGALVGPVRRGGEIGGEGFGVPDSDAGIDSVFQSFTRILAGGYGCGRGGVRSHRVPRRQRSYAALRLPRPRRPPLRSSLASGLPRCGGLVLHRRTGASADRCNAGDISTPAPHQPALSRGDTRGSQVPGPSSSCVPCSTTPPGATAPRPSLGAVAVAFRLSNTLGTLESRFLSWLHGSRPTRSRTYASPNPLPFPAQGSLPAGRAHPWPGGFRTRWMTNKVS